MPPLRDAFGEFAVLAARSLDIPLSLSASYCLLFVFAFVATVILSDRQDGRSWVARPGPTLCAARCARVLAETSVRAARASGKGWRPQRPESRASTAARPRISDDLSNCAALGAPWNMGAGHRARSHRGVLVFVPAKS